MAASAQCDPTVEQRLLLIFWPGWLNLGVGFNILGHVRVNECRSDDTLHVLSHDSQGYGK